MRWKSRLNVGWLGARPLVKPSRRSHGRPRAPHSIATQISSSSASNGCCVPRGARHSGICARYSASDGIVVSSAMALLRMNRSSNNRMLAEERPRAYPS